MKPKKKIIKKVEQVSKKRSFGASGLEVCVPPLPSALTKSLLLSYLAIRAEGMTPWHEVVLTIVVWFFFLGSLHVTEWHETATVRKRSSAYREQLISNSKHLEWGWTSHRHPFELDPHLGWLYTPRSPETRYEIRDTRYHMSADAWHQIHTASDIL